MEQLSTDNIVEIAIVAISYLVLVIGAYIKLNIKITEISKDIMVQKRELEEHKISNKDSFDEMKILFKEYKGENKSDHISMKDDLSDINKNINDFKLDVLQILNVKNKKK